MNKEISKTTFIWMLVIAGFADLVSFGITLIPVVGQVVNPIFGFIVALTFWFWFAWIGLGWHGFWGSGASTAIEIIPFLQALPPFTAMVLTIYFRKRIKQRVGKVVGSIRPKAPSITSLKKAV